MQAVARLVAMVGGTAPRAGTARPTAKPQDLRGARPTVVPMVGRKQAAQAAWQTAEEQIPLGDTGTFGSF
jgi:hypothetical protein